MGDFCDSSDYGSFGDIKNIREDLMKNTTCDGEIRDVLIKDLESNKNNIKIIQELGLGYYNSRIDIAVINQEFCGYEIKSDRDTLKRLDMQIYSYNNIFDRITIVLGRNKISEAKKIIPDFWGTIIAFKKDGKLLLKKCRRAELNKNINLQGLVNLLWRIEIAQILRGEKLYKGLSGYSKYGLVEVVLEKISEDKIRSHFKKILTDRLWEWRTEYQKYKEKCRGKYIE